MIVFKILIRVLLCPFYVLILFLVLYITELNVPVLISISIFIQIHIYVYAFYIFAIGNEPSLLLNVSTSDL